MPLEVTCTALKYRTVPGLGNCLVVPGDPDTADSLIGYYPGQEPAATYTKCTYGPDSNGTEICVLVPCGPLSASVSNVLDMPPDSAVPTQVDEYFDCADFCNEYNASFEMPRDDDCSWSGGTPSVESTLMCLYPPGDPNEGDPVYASLFKFVAGAAGITFVLNGDGSVDVFAYGVINPFADAHLNTEAQGTIILDTVAMGECKEIDERDPNWTITMESIDVGGSPCKLEGAVITVTKA